MEATKYCSICPKSWWLQRSPRIEGWYPHLPTDCVFDMVTITSTATSCQLQKLTLHCSLWISNKKVLTSWSGQFDEYYRNFENFSPNMAGKIPGRHVLKLFKNEGNYWAIELSKLGAKQFAWFGARDMLLFLKYFELSWYQTNATLWMAWLLFCWVFFFLTQLPLKIK